MIVEDENKFYDILKDTLNLDKLYLLLKILKYLYNILDSSKDYNIMELVIFSLFHFEYYFNKFLKDQKSAFIDNF